MRPVPPRASRAKPRLPDTAALATEVLTFLAEDPARCGAFLAASGLAVEDLRAASGTPAFAEALLDHLCGDDATLVAFAQRHGYDPEAIERLRRSLSPFQEEC